MRRRLLTGCTRGKGTWRGLGLFPVAKHRWEVAARLLATHRRSGFKWRRRP
uniref:Uncharacterized protein n=1 Tax=Arundo donax TaxID=35708 RepID=A0A0A9GX12_ARUDO